MAPAEIVELCKPLKQAMDMNTSTVDQAAAAIYLEGVDWATRTAELRAVYAAPMRAILDRLGDVLPDGSSFTRPRGGVFVWVELAEGWSTRALLGSAVEHGIFFMPGAVFLADVEDDRSLRLSISNHTPDSIDEGMTRLSKAITATPAPVSMPAR
jgi:DNA-binding transcriptional MocR family regulator